MGLTQLDFYGHNKVEVAIMRLKEFCPPEGYYLAFSGGKDSEVVYDLAVKSGVKFDAHFNVTTVDPPEVLKFIKENYPNVEWERPNRTMYQIIEKHGLPTRKYRHCCEELKERGGEGRFCLTGIRAQESNNRALRSMVEFCTNKDKKFLHPIIDWTSKEVWKYIHDNKLSYCSLYDEGFKRIGCVLCPMTGAKKTQEELARWPKFGNAYRIAIEKLFNRHVPSMAKFKSAEEMWQWWLSRKGQKKDDGQCSMFI